jgi:hypothetical protein
MKLEVRTWNISGRSQSEQRVKATSVKEDDASVIFTDAQGDLVATFRLSEVLGYLIEPIDEIILVVRSVLDESVPDAPPVSEDKRWKVLLPSKKKHHLEAANVLEHDGRVTNNAAEFSRVPGLRVLDWKST